MSEKKLSELDEKIVHALPYGKSNAINQRDLANIFDINGRSIAERARQLKQSGRYLVGFSRSGSGGYYIISNEDEYRENLAMIKSQVNEGLKAIKALNECHARNCGKFPRVSEQNNLSNTDITLF